MSDTESDSRNEGKDVSPGQTTSCKETGMENHDNTFHTANITLNTTASGDSEYETLEEDNGDSASSASCHSRSSSPSEDGDSGSEDLVMSNEREDGDGQEENSVAKDKKLDDDEDRRNPQYIPKKGTFYEHDDRLAMDEIIGTTTVDSDLNKREKVDGTEKDQKPVKNRKVWTEKSDRWTHDLYNEEDQKPKTKQELIETYGYDIRNEEAPPKARRRRRYGRGPNKYTRNWEDEDAYVRSVPVQRRVFHSTREDFPDLDNSDSHRAPRRREKVQGREGTRSPPRRQPPQTSGRPAYPGKRSNSHSQAPPSRGTEKVVKFQKQPEVRTPEKVPVQEAPPAAIVKDPPMMIVEEKPIVKQPPPPPTPTINNNIPKVADSNDQPGKKDNEVVPKVGRGRGFRGTGKVRPSVDPIPTRGRTMPLAAFPKEPVDNDTLKRAADMLIQDFSQMYVSNRNGNNPPTNIVEETIIPRSERPNKGNGEGNGGGGRAKRYSTQRQRSLPETTPSPAYSPPLTIPYYTQPPPNTYVPAQVYNDVAPPTVTSPPMQMVAFLPPVPPPTGAAAPSFPPPPLLNYIPPPTYQTLALQPPMSGQFDDLTQGAEMFQGQSGITYYSMQTQMPRANPPRRVKLAIPIVPPPDMDGSKHSAVS